MQHRTRESNLNGNHIDIEAVPEIFTGEDGSNLVEKLLKATKRAEAKKIEDEILLLLARDFNNMGNEPSQEDLQTFHRQCTEIRSYLQSFSNSESVKEPIKERINSILKIVEHYINTTDPVSEKDGENKDSESIDAVATETEEKPIEEGTQEYITAEEFMTRLVDNLLAADDVKQKTITDGISKFKKYFEEDIHGIKHNIFGGLEIQKKYKETRDILIAQKEKLVNIVDPKKTKQADLIKNTLKACIDMLETKIKDIEKSVVAPEEKKSNVRKERVIKPLTEPSTESSVESAIDFSAKDVQGIQLFLTELLINKDIFIDETRKNDLLDKITGLLEDEFDKVKNKSVFELKNLQRKILHLETYLDDMYEFRGKKGKPFTNKEQGIGSRIPNHKNKQGKAIFLQGLYTNFGEILKKINSLIPQNKEEKTQDAQKQKPDVVPAKETSNSAPKKEGRVGTSEVVVTGEIKSILDIYTLFSKNLSEIPTDKMTLIEIQENISLVLQEEYGRLDSQKDDSRRAVKINSFMQKVEAILDHIKDLKETRLDTNLINFIEHVEGDISEFKADILENRKKTQDRKTKPVTITVTNLRSPGTPSTPETEDPVVENTVTETSVATMESMLDDIVVHDSDSYLDTTSFAKMETIKNDIHFNGWLEHIAKKNRGLYNDYSHNYYIEPKTLEGWHAEYTKQAEKIAVVKALLQETKLTEKLFASFTTPEENKFAQEKVIRDIEWGLLVTPEKTGKAIETLVQIKKEIDDQIEKIKNLEEKEKSIERALLNRGDRIEGELAFDIIYGEEADSVKLQSFELFLSDMDKNYRFYHGSTNTVDTQASINKMFKLYEASKGGAEDEDDRKIGLLKGMWKKTTHKIKHIFKEDDNYGDKVAFKANIELLQMHKLVPSPTTDRATAEMNMAHLRDIIRSVKFDRAMNPDHTLDQSLEASGNNSPLKEAFKSIFTTYLKNKGKHSSIQEKARTSEEAQKRVQKIKGDIESVKRQKTDTEGKVGSFLLSDNMSFEKFTKEAKSELTLQELRSMNITVKELSKKQDIPLLNMLSDRLQKINLKQESDTEIHSLHKKISLELAQIYVRIVAARKEASLAPNMMRNYKLIFNSLDSEIPKNKKKEYAKTIIDLLKNRLSKTTVPLHKLELQRIIGEFESIEKTLA